MEFKLINRAKKANESISHTPFLITIILTDFN